MAIFGFEEQFMITFLFVLAVVFGALRISNVLKSGPASALLAITVAAFAASYVPFVKLLWTMLPSLTWFFIVIFIIAFIFEMFGVRKPTARSTFQSITVNSAVLLLLLTVGWMATKYVPSELPIIGSPQNLIFLLMLIFILTIFWGALSLGEAPLAQQKR